MGSVGRISNVLKVLYTLATPGAMQESATTANSTAQLSAACPPSIESPRSSYYFQPFQESSSMDPDAHWNPAPAKALLYVHDNSAVAGHISELMHEHMPQLGALQVDRDPEDGVFVFNKRPYDYFEAGKKWKSKDYDDPVLHQIAHNGIWVPANTGKLPALDFIPRMQALLPNLPPNLRDSLLSKLNEDPKSYAQILSCSPLKEIPSFRSHFGNGIVVVLKNEVDFRTFTNSDCILSDTCGRRPIPYVSKRDIYVPRLNLKKGCLTCGGDHRMSDCPLHKQYVNVKAVIIQRAMINYYKLSKHILNYLDPVPEEVILPDTSTNAASALKSTSVPPPSPDSEVKEADPKKRKPAKDLKQSSITSYANKASEKQYTGPDFDTILGGGGTVESNAPKDISVEPPTRFFLQTNTANRPCLIYHTEPDGNCFFHSISHPQSPVRHLLLDSAQQLRSACYLWCLRNKPTLDLIAKKSFGDNSPDEIMQRLEQAHAWVNYPIVIITAIAFQIDILILSPGRSMNLLVSDFCARKGIPFSPTKGHSVSVLYHEHGGDLYDSNITANHFSLLIPENEIATNILLDELKVVVTRADAVCISSSESEASDELPNSTSESFQVSKLSRSEEYLVQDDMNLPGKKKKKKKKSNRKKRKHAELNLPPTPNLDESLPPTHKPADPLPYPKLTLKPPDSTPPPLNININTQVTTRKFLLYHTPPDGNCFFHSLNHPVSPVRRFLTGSAKHIRQTCYKWCLQNKLLLEAVTRKAYGDHSPEEILQILEHDKTWINYPIIIITALVFQIDILVIGPPGESSNILTSEFCVRKRIPFVSPRGTVALLYHSYENNNWNNPINESTANHFSLIILEKGHQPLQLLQEFRVCIPREEAIIVSSDSDTVSETTPYANNEDQVIPSKLAKMDANLASMTGEPKERNTKKKKSKKNKRKRKQDSISQPQPQCLSTSPHLNISHNPVTKVESPTPPLLSIPKENLLSSVTTQPEHSTDCVTILSWNATSLLIDGRFPSLLDLTRDIDIICVQEANLLQAPKVKGYNTEFNRGPIRPRGIIALIREHIVYCRRKDIEASISPLETIVIEMFGSQGPWLLVEIYFNPDSELPDDSLVKGLESLEKFGMPVVMCGDYNSPGNCFGGDNVEKPSHRGKLLDSFMLFNDYYCIQSDFDYTFFRGEDTRSCLDGVITSHTASAYCHSTLLPAIAPGHKPYVVAVSLGCRVSKLPTEINLAYIESNFFDWTVFLKKMDEFKTPEFNTVHDVKKFTDTIQNAQIKAVRLPKSKHKNEGWWNDVCREALKNRNIALRKLQKCRPHTNPAKFRRRKKAYNKAKKKMQAIFREQKAKWKEWTINQASRSSSSKIWRVISKLCGSKQSRRKTPQCTLLQTQALSKAQELCTTFEDIQSAPDLIALSENTQTLLPRLPKYLSSEERIRDWEIDQALHRVKAKSCPGPDNIKVHALIRLWYNPKWKEVIVRLMNSLFAKPELFTQFKHAIVHPIPKPGKADAFRPISLLSQLGKILERILAQRIQRLLDIPNQFGCTPHKSTRDVLVRLQHWAVQACHGALSIFFDISKAYDRVIPKLVVQKLAKIPGLNPRIIAWIHDFLTHRSFQVRINGIMCERIGRPKFGLPQGSPLSVVLWKVFISDIPIEKDDNIFMDDINYNIEEPSYEEAAETANFRLGILDFWAKKNGVIFDKEKTKVLVHESCTEVHLRFHPTDTKYIPLVNRYKYLGTWLKQRNIEDLGFSLEAQFKKEQNEFSRRLAWIKSLYKAPLYIRRTAYLSLVRSKLAYSLPLTIRNYSEELEKLQTRALRVVAHAPNSFPGDRIRYLLRLPSFLELAKSQAVTLRANMLAYGGLLADDYEFWITQEEGVNNEDTPFGTIQSESLVHNDDLFFQEYQLLTRSHLDSLQNLILNTKSPEQCDDLADSLICYSDGSFNPTLNTGGTGIYCTHHPMNSLETDLKLRFKYSFAWSSYNCELLALRDTLQALVEFFITSDKNANRIVIFTDCQSVIYTLAGVLKSSWTHYRTPLLVNVVDLIAMLQTTSIVTISWVKGHSGILGNEIADTLAKSAVSEDNVVTRTNYLDSSYFRRKAKLICRPEAPERTHPIPGYIRKAICKTENPKIGSMITRIIGNHYFLKGCYYERTSNTTTSATRKRLRKLNSTVPTIVACRFCSKEPETVEHIVNKCKAYEVEARRYVLRGKTWAVRPYPSHNTLLLNILSTPAAWYPLHEFFQGLNLSP
jgi:ribonuclease HI